MVMHQLYTRGETNQTSYNTSKAIRSLLSKLTEKLEFFSMSFVSRLTSVFERLWKPENQEKMPKCDQ